MEAIRKMEPAWENVQGSKFRLSQRNYELPTRGMKSIPCYSLTTNRYGITVKACCASCKYRGQETAWAGEAT